MFGSYRTGTLCFPRGDILSASFFKSLDAAIDRLPEPDRCTAILYHRTLYSPDEWCEEYAVPGEELCARHMPREWDG
jgi:hypothetical protein